jgi:carboxypeptidase D
LAGESFAGQYIPVYAKEILNAIDSHTLPMRLSGLAIGNGWIDPVPQYLSYVSYAVKYNILAGPDMERFKAQMANCQRSLKNTSSGKIGNSACDSAFEFAIKTSSLSAKSNGKCLNMYDIRSTDQQCGMSWPPGLDNMAKYLTVRCFYFDS